MTHNDTPTRLILASSSPYRHKLLSRLKLAFDWADPSIDESTLPGESAMGLSQRLSRQKAQAIGDNHGDPLIIGSDQVAACDNRLLGKPGSADAAREQLAFCSGKHIVFFTSIALWRPSHQLLREETESVEVSMRTLTSREINAYIAADKPIDCAGSFKVESLGVSLFRSITARDPTALEGLPLITLSAMLRDAGYLVP